MLVYEWHNVKCHCQYWWPPSRLDSRGSNRADNKWKPYHWLGRNALPQTRPSRQA